MKGVKNTQLSWLSWCLQNIPSKNKIPWIQESMYLFKCMWNTAVFQLVSHIWLLCDPPPPHPLEHTRLLCLSLSPGVCSNSCPLSQSCYLIISSSATLFSFCLQSFPASGSFPMSRLICRTLTKTKIIWPIREVTVKVKVIKSYKICHLTTLKLN